MEEPQEGTLPCPLISGQHQLYPNNPENIWSFSHPQDEKICSGGFSLLFLPVPKSLGELSSLPSRCFWQPQGWKPSSERKSESREHHTATQLMAGNTTRCCKTREQQELTARCLSAHQSSACVPSCSSILAPSPASNLPTKKAWTVV